MNLKHNTDHYTLTRDQGKVFIIRFIDDVCFTVRHLRGTFVLRTEDPRIPSISFFVVIAFMVHCLIHIFSLPTLSRPLYQRRSSSPISSEGSPHYKYDFGLPTYHSCHQGRRHTKTKSTEVNGHRLTPHFYNSPFNVFIS